MPSGGLHHKQRGPEEKHVVLLRRPQPRSDLPQWTKKSIVSVSTANIYLRRKQKKKAEKHNKKEKTLHSTPQGKNPVDRTIH